MIWYILLALGFAASVWFNWDDLSSRFNRGDGVFLVLVQTFGLAVVLFGIGSIFSTWGPLEPKHLGDYPIVAVNDGSKIEGSAFIFSGYVDQSLVYNFYEKTGEDSYQRGYQYATNTTIVEDTKDTAYLRQYHLVPNEWIGFTWMPHLRNEFHVPPGSVVHKVTFDNE